MTSWRPIRRLLWFWILLVPAVLALALYWRAWPNAPIMGPDSPWYLTAARHLASAPAAHPEFRTPGYPILLRLAGATEGPTRELFLFQLLLQVAAVFLACAALRAVGAGTALTVAIGVVGLLPPYVLRSAFVLTENLAQFCVVLAVASLQRFLDRRRAVWLALSSLAFGYAAMTRPTFQLASVAAGLLLWLLAARTRAVAFSFREALALMAGTVFLIGAYAGYNLSRYGVPGTTSTLGLNLADLGPSLYEQIPDPITRRLLVEARNDAYVHGRSVEWAHYRAYDRLIAERHMTPEEIEPWVRGQLLRAIRGHPIQYLQAVAVSASRFWFPAAADLPLLREKRFQLFWYALHFLVVGLLAAETFAFAAWFLLAGAGVRFSEALHRPWVLWFVSMTVVLYNAAVSCFLETGEVRFRSATEMLLLLAAGAGVVGARRLLWALPLLKTGAAPAATR